MSILDYFSFFELFLGILLITVGVCLTKGPENQSGPQMVSTGLFLISTFPLTASPTIGITLANGTLMITIIAAFGSAFFWNASGNLAQPNNPIGQLPDPAAVVSVNTSAAILGLVTLLLGCAASLPTPPTSLRTTYVDLLSFVLYLLAFCFFILLLPHLSSSIRTIVQNWSHARIVIRSCQFNRRHWVYFVILIGAAATFLQQAPRPLMPRFLIYWR